VQAFMLEGQLQKDRNPLVRPALVFAGHIKEYIVPAVSPVCGKTVPDPFRPLRQQ
jgi:hypothetical protein